jgi:hypothetical protein
MLQKKTDETARTFFRVAGTNRSSQQSVVFSGYFFALTNNVTFASASGTNAPVSTTAVSAAAAVPVLDQPALRNSLFQGLVEINNGRPIPLQATSAPAMQR